MAESSRKITKIEPQPGYQMKALSSSADIVIGGAAAGVGKTFSLLLEPVRHHNVKGFGAVAFRRTTTQIKSEGGLWDTSKEIFTHLKAKPRETFLEWKFPGGQKLKFSHMEHEKNVLDWQGSQIALILFDELTHFSQKMFFYMLSRNRSTCGIKPYVRATCNPDPDSWLADFISWWIDPETGDPIPERDGVIRYFFRSGKEFIWADTAEECIAAAWHIIEPLASSTGTNPKYYVKSVAFISGSIFDNKALLDKDPGYVGNLLAQDEETVARLFKGNWKHIENEQELYNYQSLKAAFEMAEPAPGGHRCIVADIALEGTNMFVILYFEGWEIKDASFIQKSNGKEVVTAIELMASKYSVPNNCIVYDADGVGGFVEGYIPGAVAFHGGSPAIEAEDPITRTIIKEKYANLRTQCYYRSAARVNRDGLKIAEHVAYKMYDKSQTVKQRIMFERKAIRRAKTDMDGNRCIINKAQMKQILGAGQSPDIMDCFMMREFLELRPPFEIIVL